MVARHKVLGSVGRVLASFVENDCICHSTTAITIQKTVKKRVKVDDACLVLQKSHASDSWAVRKRSRRIVKIAISRPNVPVDAVAAVLEGFYRQRLVALKMQLDSGVEQTWLNPLLIEGLERMEEAKAKINESNGNDAARRFFEKMVRLLETDVTVDWGETSSRLALELENFRRPFEFA